MTNPCAEIKPQIDIYSRVANRTGKSREDVKYECFFLFYTPNSLPKDPMECIEYLVAYFGGDKHEI